MQNVNHFINGTFMSLTRSSINNLCHPYFGPYDPKLMKTVVVKPHLITAVSGSAKIDGENFNEFRFGEDSWFIANGKKADVLGVADGVGGWRAFGVDSGQFSTQFMHVAENLVMASEYNSKEPKELLEHTYYIMKDQNKNIFGSCTACVLSFNREDRTAYAANLGDSGFIIARNGKAVIQSKPQHHSFNVPYQLTVPPPHYPSVNESAYYIEGYTKQVEPGDIIMLATDGVFDNIPQDVILDLLKVVEGTADQAKLQLIADSVAYTAWTLSKDEQFISPFSLSARAIDLDRPGGKEDDITVVLATISENEKTITLPVRETSVPVD